MANQHTNSNEVQIPPEVYAQLEALRQSGVVNMFTEVQAGLERFGYYEALEWLTSNPETYVEGFQRGFTPQEDAEVNEIDPTPLRNAISNRSGLSERDDATTPNERSVLNHVESISRLSEAAAEYHSEGEWRDTSSLTAKETEIAEQIDEAVDCQPNQCFRNSLLATATFANKHDVVYVEGATMTNELISPLEHAWVELNGKVVELTFPDGPEPASDAAYLGIEYSLNEVKSKVYDEGVAGQIAPGDNSR